MFCQKKSPNFLSRFKKDSLCHSTIDVPLLGSAATFSYCNLVRWKLTTYNSDTPRSTCCCKMLSIVLYYYYFSGRLLPRRRVLSSCPMTEGLQVQIPLYTRPLRFSSGAFIGITPYSAGSSHPLVCDWVNERPLHRTLRYYNGGRKVLN